MKIQSSFVLITLCRIEKIFVTCGMDLEASPFQVHYRYIRLSSTARLNQAPCEAAKDHPQRHFSLLGANG